MNKLGKFAEDKISYPICKASVVDLAGKYRQCRGVSVVLVLKKEADQKEYVFDHLKFTDELAKNKTKYVFRNSSEKSNF